MMKRVSLFLVVLTMGMLASAQAVYQLDSNNITIGDQVTLTISGESNYRTMEELSQNGVLALKQTYDSVNHLQFTTITSFDEGEHSIKFGDEDSIVLAVNDVEGVDTVNIEVKDIADIIKVRYTFWEIFRWILLGLAVVAVVVAIVYVIKRLKAHKPIIELHVEPPIPPDTRALNALEELRRKELWQAGKLKEYYTDLTDIVRNYLEEAWDIPSTDMTSDETLEAFAGSKAYSETNDTKLRQILKTADMVKFAKSEPLPNEHTQAMNYATEFVVSLSELSSQQAATNSQASANSNEQ